MALPTNPASVDEVFQEDPIIRRVRERINRRMRESAGGATIPTQILPEEVLRRRYREVLAGFEKFGRREIIQKHLVSFEEALRDLEVCAECRACHVESLGKDDRSLWQQFMVTDCPFGIEPKPWEEVQETHGHIGFYYAIAEESRYAEEPIFRYHNCPGPVLRMKQHAARYRWRGDATPPESPHVDSAQVPGEDPAWRD